MRILAKRVRENIKSRGGCEECFAEINQRCLSSGCKNYFERHQNAPLCHDGLHHHCALMPFCRTGCVDDQRVPEMPPAMMEDIQSGVAETERCCSNCRFYMFEVCRRHSPAVIDCSWDHPSHGRQFETRTAWPPVQPTDICGDHKFEDEP